MKTQIENRPYQQEAIESIVRTVEGDEHGKFLGVASTGAGKTVIAGGAIDRLLQIHDDYCVLVLADRRILVQQFVESLRDFYGIHLNMEMAEHEAGALSDMVCGTLQTLDRRYKKYARGQFDLLIYDEADVTAFSPTGRKLMNYFSNAKVLGLTATPRRSDLQQMFSLFDFVGDEESEGYVFDVNIKTLVDSGYLARPVVQPVDVKIDATSLAFRGNDYDEQSIADVIEPYLSDCLDAIAANRGRRFLVFLPLIKTSKAFAKLAEKKGLKFVHMDGFMAQDEGWRREVISDLKTGAIDGVCNAMLLSRGTDIPEVDALMVLRPTKSWSLYVQMIGRALRTSKHTGKKDALILDPLWISGDHNIIIRPEEIMVDVLPSGTATQVKEEVENEEDPCYITDPEKVSPQEATLMANLARNRGKGERKTDLVEYMMLHGISADGGGLPRSITPKTRAILKKLGIAGAKGTEVQAKAIIASLRRKDPATEKQLGALRAHGVDCQDWSKTEASKYIYYLRRSGKWRWK